MINKNLYDSLLRLRKSQKKYYKLVYLMRKHANENLSKERRISSLIVGTKDDFYKQK